MELFSFFEKSCRLLRRCPCVEFLDRFGHLFTSIADSLLASIAGRGTSKAINYFVVGIVILRRTGLAMQEALKKSIFSYGFGFVPTHVFACRVDAAFESCVASAMASWVVSFTVTTDVKVNGRDPLSDDDLPRNVRRFPSSRSIEVSITRWASGVLMHR